MGITHAAETPVTIIRALPDNEWPGTFLCRENKSELQIRSWIYTSYTGGNNIHCPRTYRPFLTVCGQQTRKGRAPRIIIILSSATPLAPHSRYIIFSTIFRHDPESDSYCKRIGCYIIP